MIATELPKPNDYRFTVVTTMKDEGPYILDWISYHIAIGFTHFVILTNDCRDGTDKICRNLEKLGIVTHQNNKPPYPRGIQKTAWKRAARNDAIRQAEWLISLDVDEYLGLNIGEGSVSEVVELFDENLCAISFPWQFYGDNGVHDLVDMPVWQQFTRSSHPLQAKPYQIRGLKTLYRNIENSEIGTHRPKFPRELAKDKLWVSADGVLLPYLFTRPHWCAWDDGTGFGITLGRVHHYAIRSREAFMLKMQRGFVNRTDKGPRSESSPKIYWDMFNWNVYETDEMAGHGACAVRIRDYLNNNQKIKKLHDQAFEHHKSEIETVISKPENLEEFQEIFTAPMRQELSKSDPILNAGSEIPFLFDPQLLQKKAEHSILHKKYINGAYGKLTLPR